MNDIVMQIDGLSKQYRLGEVSTGSLGHDLNRWWHRLRGKEDPYLSITGENIRTRRREAAVSSGYVWALRDIAFEVKRGEVLGIIGRNGAGKSTLLKLLSRITAPTTGEIRIDGRIGALLEVGTGFHQDLTGRENIYLNGAILGMTKAEIRAKLDEIVDFSGCAAYLDTPVKRYSSGMVVRLGFAVAAHLEPEILIVDEVLAVGDAEFQKKCIGKMQDVASHGRTVLFVSHNMSSIKNLCKTVIILSNGLLERVGPSGDIVDQYLAATLKSDAAIPAAAHRVTSPLQVTSIVFGADESQASPITSSGRPIAVRLTIENSGNHDNTFVVGIEWRIGGESITSMVSPELFVKSHAVCLATCRIPENIFRPGILGLSVGLTSMTDRRLADLLTDVATLVVSPDSSDHVTATPWRTHGAVNLPHTWTCHSAGPP